LTSGHSDAHDWASECPDVKNYKWRLNPVWHKMLLYNCTHMATVSVKGLLRSVRVVWRHSNHVEPSAWCAVKVAACHWSHSHIPTIRSRYDCDETRITYNE